MSNNTAAIPRLTREYRALLKNPIEGIILRPDPSNLLNWYFVIDGPAHPALKKGKYFGRVVLPTNYPYSPPAVFIDTPSFIFSTNENVCMTNTAYHAESWTTTWTVGSLVNSLRMFMATRYSELEFRATPSLTLTKQHHDKIGNNDDDDENNPARQSSQLYSDTIHYTNLSFYTTYRIKQFQDFFPELKQEFKYQISLRSYEFFQNQINHTLFDTITSPSERELAIESSKSIPIRIDNSNSLVVSSSVLTTTTSPTSLDEATMTTMTTTVNSLTVATPTVKSKATQAIAALTVPDTFNRVPTPIVLANALNDFSPSEQLYINHLDQKIPKGIKGFMKTSPFSGVLVWVIAVVMVALSIQFLLVTKR